MNNQIATTTPQPLALTQDPVAGMLQKMIDGGVTKDNVEALTKLADLYERMQTKDAEKQFAAAFVALQSEMPSINMTKTVPDRNGNVKFTFAPYEEIMATVRPLLQKHGFTVTFSMSYGDGRITQNCTLQHIGGFSRTNQFQVRIGGGPPGASECQADGAASTYAKRFAFCNALNIICEKDTDGMKPDAKVEGAPIGADKVQYLREQLEETRSNPAPFLAMAGVKSLEEICEGSYPTLVRAIELKKRK
jgi:hypothetical protein